MLGFKIYVLLVVLFLFLFSGLGRQVQGFDELFCLDKYLFSS